MLVAASGCAKSTSSGMPGAGGISPSGPGLSDWALAHPMDWDLPFGRDAEKVPTRQAAQDMVTFELIFPPELGTPSQIYVLVGTNAEDNQVAAVYDHPSYGRLWLKQGITGLEPGGQPNMVAECASPPRVCHGDVSNVVIREGIVALLASNAEISTLLRWLEDGVTYTVIGPSDTLTANDALAVAQML
jgi:hypothetical protein